MTQKSKHVIRFAIMCNDLQFQQWQAHAIQSLVEHEEIECCLLIKDKRGISRTSFKNRLRLIKKRNILWQAFLFLSRAVSRAVRPVDLSLLLKDVPTIECHVIRKGKFSEYFQDSDISDIKNHQLDFILRFGFGIIRGDILNAASCGVWSFHHGDEQKYRGGPPGFWEIFNHDNITGSILQRLTNALDAGIVLKRGFLKTNWSYVRNRDQMLLQSARWPLQVCKDILSGHSDYLHDEPSPANAPIWYAPSNRQFIEFLFKSTFTRIKHIARIIARVDYWNFGVTHAPIHSFLDPQCHPPVAWFPHLPRDRFVADPFALAEGTKLHIFYEEYPYRDRRGHIAYTCYEHGVFSIPQTVILEPFHLSYPYLIKSNGHIYMVPESYETHQIILYRAIRFPLRWTREQVLIDHVAGVDSTLFEHQGTWWMFTSDRDDGSSHNLNLYYADDLCDTWKPHPQNPIKTDVRSARSAGTPFMHEGDLYRPSMDYSEKTEGRITINKVTILTRDQYQEVSHNGVSPYRDSKYPDKIHTLSESGAYTVIDGCKETHIWTNIHLTKFMVGMIVRKAKKILKI